MTNVGWDDATNTSVPRRNGNALYADGEPPSLLPSLFASYMKRPTVTDWRFASCALGASKPFTVRLSPRSYRKAPGAYRAMTVVSLSSSGVVTGLVASAAIGSSAKPAVEPDGSRSKPNAAPDLFPTEISALKILAVCRIGD